MKSKTKEYIQLAFGTIGFILTIVLLAILINVFLISLSCAWEGQRVQFHFENDIAHKAIYRMKWIDHDLDRKQFPGPIELAVGELKNGKRNKLEYLYRPGKYHIVWKIYPSEIEIHMYFDIKEGVDSIIIHPLYFESEHNEISKVPWWRNNWAKSSNVWEVESKEN